MVNQRVPMFPHQAAEIEQILFNLQASSEMLTNTLPFLSGPTKHAIRRIVDDMNKKIDDIDFKLRNPRVEHDHEKEMSSLQKFCDECSERIGELQTPAP
ncbi:unnamed protein product [Caenorhabditis angaria]|uniref:Uncharacterized protein n=1 Tax=Caenorhabditis angaria TaxID=860376 RepID=A0A9P1J3T2_9PELO|nr:unnamed protein product [Caenorhabditis angaria]